MVELAERMTDKQMRARLMVLAAFCRAHASRLLGRLAEMEVPVKVLLAPTRPLCDDLAEALRREGRVANTMVMRYTEWAEQARRHNDLLTAWVYELNRTEELDRGRELLQLAAQLTRGDSDTAASPGQTTQA